MAREKDDRVSKRTTKSTSTKGVNTWNSYLGGSGRTVESSGGDQISKSTGEETTSGTSSGTNTSTATEATAGTSTSTQEDKSESTGKETTSGTSSGTNKSTMTDATEDTNTSTQKEDKGLVLKFRIPIQSKNPVSRI